MIVMGIDQSLTQTGYAVIDFRSELDYKYLTTGVIKTSKLNGGNIFPEQKMIYIASELNRIATEYKIDYLAMENLMTFRMSSHDTVQKLSGLFYVILCKFVEQGYLVSLPMPTEWKNAIGIEGKKRAEQKTSSIKIARTLSKRAINNDDEADAVCIAMFGAKLDIEEG